MIDAPIFVIETRTFVGESMFNLLRRLDRK